MEKVQWNSINKNFMNLNKQKIKNDTGLASKRPTSLSAGTSVSAKHDTVESDIS